MKHEDQRGEVPVFAIVALLVLVAIVYGITAFGGAFNDNLKVKTALTEVVNQMGKDRDADALRERIAYKLEKLVVETVPDGEGGVMELHPLKPEKLDVIEVRFDEAAGKVRVRYPYPRRVRLPILGRIHTLHFSVEVEGDVGSLGEGFK